MQRLGISCGLALGAALGVSGCHSAFVQATIDNRGASPIRLVEVDYPSASYGVGSIAAHSQFNYRFKIQGSGALKIEFADDAGKVHSVDGPNLNQGQEGQLAIVIGPGNEVSWQSKLSAPKS